MPEQDVTLTATVEEDLHTITPVEGAHTKLNILNCHYNWGTPEHIIQSSQYGIVRFRYEVDLGYDIRCIARAESGQELTIGYDPNDESYGACWWVEMPDEPLTIETVATEKNAYEGKDFVGTYGGFELRTPDNRLISGTAPSLTLELKANTSFAVVSTDRNAFDFDGGYTYDEAADKFDYVRELCKKTYGVFGFRLNGDLFIQTRNIIDDRPDHNRYYYTSKNEYSYTCASPDQYNNRFLLEIRTGGETTYYYVDLLDYTWNKVDVTFASGTSIAASSQALVSLGGTPLFRYELESAAASPVFRFKGKEAGTYTHLSGSGPALVLDGFGGGTVGDASGTYSVEKGIVTFVSDGNTVKYLIDAVALTYYEVESDEAWDGAAHLYAESEYGYNSDVSSSSWVKGWIYLDMDCDYTGEPKPRYARIHMYLPDMYGRRIQIITDSVPYVYDTKNGTLVLSQVVQGKPDGWGQVRRDMTFTVSEQKTVVFTTEKVTSMTTPNKYIQTLGLELTPAPEE